MIANAQVENKPIIFCNDGFCELSGYARADVMQKPCTCDFLHGPLTSSYSIRHVKNALDGCDEQQVEAQYYKKDGKLLLTLSFLLTTIVVVTTIVAPCGSGLGCKNGAFSGSRPEVLTDDHCVHIVS